MKKMFKKINKLPIIPRIFSYVALYFAILLVIGFTIGFIKGIFSYI